MKKLMSISGMVLLIAIIVGSGNLLFTEKDVIESTPEPTYEEILQKRVEELAVIMDSTPHIRTIKPTEDGILVGYNYNITKNGISEEAASIIAERIVDGHREKLESYEWFNSLDGVRQDAVLNLSFNLGVGGFLKFKGTINRLAAGDYEGASRTLLYTSRGSKTLYYRQVKGRAKEMAEQIKTGIAKEPFLKTLKRHEGFRKFPYRDSRGVWTVGYGFNIQHRGFNPEESLLLLATASLENTEIIKEYTL